MEPPREPLHLQPQEIALSLGSPDTGAPREPPTAQRPSGVGGAGPPGRSQSGGKGPAWGTEGAKGPAALGVREAPNCPVPEARPKASRLGDTG